MSVRTYTHFIEPLSSDEVTVYGYFCEELAELATIDSLDDALSYVIDDVNEQYGTISTGVISRCYLATTQPNISQNIDHSIRN